MAFYHLLDDLAAQVGPEKCILWLSADETSLSSQWALRRLWGTLSRRSGDLLYAGVISFFLFVVGNLSSVTTTKQIFFLHHLAVDKR